MELTLVTPMIAWKSLSQSWRVASLTHDNIFENERGILTRDLLRIEYDILLSSDVYE